MPENTIEQHVEAAELAVDYATNVRRYHAKRSDRDSQQRKDDIEMALSRLKEAMKPLRSEIGRFPYGAQTDAAEAVREKVRESSDAIQRERRKLWKMRLKKRPQPTEV